MANTPESKHLLESGITYLTEGDLDEARRRLIQSLKLDGDQERGWLWLRACATSERDQLLCLKKALGANGAPSVASQNKLDAAVAALREGDPGEAERRIVQALRSGDRSARAWLWLSTCVNDEEKAARCVQEALKAHTSHRARTPAPSQTEHPRNDAPPPTHTVTSNGLATPSSPAADGRKPISPVIWLALAAAAVAIIAIGMLWNRPDAAGETVDTAPQTEATQPARLTAADKRYRNSITQISTQYRTTLIEAESQVIHLRNLSELSIAERFVGNQLDVFAELKMIDQRVYELDAPERFAEPQRILVEAAQHYDRFADLIVQAMAELNVKKLDQAWVELDQAQEIRAQAEAALNQASW